jgi:hypothetical protein
MVWDISYRAQCYRGSSQTDKAAIAGVGLVDGVGIVVAELVDDFGDFIMVAFGEGVADGGLESGCFGG